MGIAVYGNRHWSNSVTLNIRSAVILVRNILGRVVGIDAVAVGQRGPKVCVVLCVGLVSGGAQSDLAAALSGGAQGQGDGVSLVIDGDIGVLVVAKADDFDVVEIADHLVHLDQGFVHRAAAGNTGQVKEQVGIAQIDTGLDARAIAVERAAVEFADLAQFAIFGDKAKGRIVGHHQHAGAALIAVKANLGVAARDGQGAVLVQGKIGAVTGQDRLGIVGNVEIGGAGEQAGVGKAPAIGVDGQHVLIGIAVSPELPGIVDIEGRARLAHGDVVIDLQIAMGDVQHAALAEIEVLDCGGSPVIDPVSGQIDAVAVLCAGQVFGGPVQPVVPAHPVAKRIGHKAQGFGLARGYRARCQSRSGRISMIRSASTT